MKFTQKLLSLVTSLALACGMAANMLPVQAAAAQPAPTITLTADKTTVCVGEPVTLTVSIDGSKAAFAGLAATLQYDTSAFTFTGAVKDYKGSDYDKVTCPQLNEKNELSRLVLEADAAAAVNLGKVVSCTFIANKTGKTFAFSLSGDFSVKGTDSTDFSAVSTNISVSAKTLTADVSESAKLSGTYGEDLSQKIQSDMVTFKDGDTTVKPDGTWSFSGSAPSVTDKEATFRFTPKDTSTYAPLDVAFPVTITPKAVDPKLSVKPDEKMYDSSTDLTTDQKAVITLDGVIPADEGKVSADFSSIAYDAADSGERTITASGIELTGDRKDNYKLSADSCTAKGSITPYTGKVSVQENFISRSFTNKPQPLQEGELVLTANGKTLQPDTDYTITYPNGCTGTENADTEISYTLTGKGNYAGCTFTGSTGKFTIYARPLPTVKTGSSLGDPITAVYQQKYTLPTVSNDILNETNAQGTLSLRYKQGSGEWSTEAPSKPGEYTIGVYFKSSTDKYSSGMLNGISTTLTIQKAEGSGTVTMEDYTYGDNTPAPVPTSTTNGTADVSYRYTGDNYDSDKAPVNAGKYTVTATFKATEIYNEAAATASFTVSPKELTDNDVKFSSAEFTYNGEVQKPELQTSLTAEDYNAVYSDESSTIVGSYTVTVTGKGNYTGTVTYSYTIKKANGSGSVTMADYTYGDKAPAPVPTSATNGTTGVSYTYEGRDGTTYAKSETAPTNAGSYTVTASFKESANATACTATANFTVHPKGIVAGDFTMDKTEFTYGDGQKPTVSPVTEGIDYTVEYPQDSTNAGSYKVTVTGKGNYTGTVELSYKINPAVYKLPEGAKITTELETYPVNIYGGQPLSHIGLKAEDLPEGAQFGWSTEDRDKTLSAGTASYKITVDPNDPNYSAGTATVSVTLAKAIAPADSKEGITGQLSTVAASISKTASENGKLSAGASADIAKLTRSDKLTPKEQDDLKSAHLSDAALLAALDKSAENVTVSTQLNKGEKSALTGLAITTGGKAALGADSGTAAYTAKDITPEKPADGQLIEVELSLGSGQQPAVPVLVSLSFNAKNADQNGKFQVVHKHTETDASKNFTTQYDCRSVSKSGDTVTVQFLAASFSSFSIQYTAPASGGSSSPSATPKPDEPQPQPTATPALTASETTWLGGYGALLNAKSGTALSLDVTACEYLPGYIITGAQKSGVTLNLSTPAGKLCLSPAVAKAMNGSYNYTFADAIAIAGKVAAAAKPAASPAPVKDPTAASPTPAPTPVPTAAPQPTQAPATPQPEAEPQEKSHSPLPMVAAVLVAAALLAGGYLAYNSASRRKALHDVYAPSKKVKLNQNQNNGRNRK